MCHAYRANLCLCEYYRRMLSDLKTAYVGDGSLFAAKLNILDAHWPHIRKAFTWMAANWHENTEVAALCLEFLKAGVCGLYYRLKPSEMVTWFEIGLCVARQFSDYKSEALMLGNIGIALKNSGDLRKAASCYQEVLSISNLHHGTRIRVTAIQNLGLAYASLGQLDRAIEVYQQALRECDEADRKIATMRILGNLGMAYHALGRIDEAMRFVNAGLEEAISRADEYVQAELLANLACCHQCLDEDAAALRLYRRALRIFSIYGDAKAKARIYGNLAQRCQDAGRYRKAEYFCRRYRDLCCAAGDIRGEASALCRLGNIYRNQGRTDQAIQLLEQAAKISQHTDDKSLQAHISWDLGLAYVMRGDKQLGIRLMQLLVDYELEIGHSDAEADQLKLQRLRDS